MSTCIKNLLSVTFLDSIITSQWFGCFPHDAQAVLTNHSPIALGDVQIGDQLLTYDLISKSFQPTRVVSFLHRDEHQYSSWIEITLRKHNVIEPSKLRLTANHLIYRRSSRSVVSVFAGDIQPGDYVVADLTNSDPFCEVTQTKIINETLSRLSYGVYAPLTTSGSLIVDGVLVSCYAHFREEWLMNLVTLPLQADFYLRQFLGHFFSNSNEIQLGLHWYVEWLLQLGRNILPDSMFFSQL